MYQAQDARVDRQIPTRRQLGGGSARFDDRAAPLPRSTTAHPGRSSRRTPTQWEFGGGNLRSCMAEARSPGRRGGPIALAERAEADIGAARRRINRTPVRYYARGKRVHNPRRACAKPPLPVWTTPPRAWTRRPQAWIERGPANHHI